MEFDLHGLTLVEAIRAYPEQACKVMQKQAMELTKQSGEAPVQQLKAEIAKQLGNFTKYRDHYRCIPDTYDKLWQLSDI